MSEILSELKDYCLQDGRGKPLYRLLYDKLEDMIITEALPDRFRLPADTQISKSLGINHITVGKALNELRKKGFLERSRSRGTFVISPTARNVLAQERGRKVMVIFDNLTRETFSTEPFMTLHEKLLENNLEMIFISSGGSSSTQFEQIKSAIINPECCGVLVWSMLNDVQVETVMRLKPVDFSLIFMGHSYNNVHYPYDASIYDHYGSGCDIGKYFMKKRFQKAIFFCRRSSLEFDSAKLRYQGLQDMMQNYGLPADNLVMETYLPNSTSKQDRINLARLVNREDDSLLVVAHDSELAELYRQLEKSGNGHRDIYPVVVFSVKGREFVDNASEMRFDSSVLAVNAVELLCRRLQGDRSKYRTVACKAEFIEKESTIGF